MNEFQETQENIIKMITSINTLYNINPEAASRLSKNVYSKYSEEIQLIDHVEIKNFLKRVESNPEFQISKLSVTSLSDENDCGKCIDCLEFTSSSSSSDNGSSSSSSSCICAPEPPSFTASGGVGGICCARVCCDDNSPTVLSTQELINIIETIPLKVEN